MHIFDDYETFMHKGREFAVTSVYDDFGDTPWDFCEPIFKPTEWTRRDKNPGELVIADDRGYRRYYNFSGAVKALRKSGVTGENAAKVARAEFEYFRGWCNGKWHYHVVFVAPMITDEHGDEVPDENHYESVGGVEDIDPQPYERGKYWWTDTAQELADRILYDEQRRLGFYCAIFGLDFLPSAPHTFNECNWKGWSGRRTDAMRHMFTQRHRSLA